MLETRSIEQRDSLCPAAYAIAETASGSGVVCRVTGNIVTTGHNPSSLAAYCWCPVAHAKAPTTNTGDIGYQACNVWKYNRDIELNHPTDLNNAPEHVKNAYHKPFITTQ